MYGGQLLYGCWKLPIPGAPGKDFQSGLIETESGGTWNPLAAPQPSDESNTVPEASLNTVTCVGAGSCTAGGTYNGSEDGEGMIETESGGTWSAIAAPVPSNATDQSQATLNSFVCPEAGSCTAVGNYNGFDGPPYGYLNALIETESGGTWSALEAPLPSDAYSDPGARLSSISCPAAGSCTASGEYVNQSIQAPLIETESDGSWTPLEAPIPNNAGSSNTYLNSTSCPAVDSCTVVGDYTDSNGNEQGLIETESGGNWSALEAPEPNDAPGLGSDLLSMACPAVNSCTAVGYYFDQNGNAQGLIETGSGGTWSPLPAPLPSNAAPSLPYTQGGGFPYGPDTTCKGCPINTATGEFFRTFNDLSVPGRGMPLAFTRTYSSAAAFDGETGPLGPGWTDSYNWNLSFDSSGNATVTAANGSSVVFAANGSGGFTAPSFVQSTLVNNSGAYTFEGNDQKRYVFNSSGQLTQEIDRNGYTTTLTYSGSELSTVTDPDGRTLTFSYGSDGDISSVTDPGGRTISFAYDPSGNLSTATNAAGGTSSFTYDSNHLLLAMKDPNGGILTNIYNSDGRVTSETDPMSRTITFSYVNNSNGSETTTETDALGNVTIWNYSNLMLKSVTRGYGTSDAATSTYTYQPATLELSSISDPDGHMTTYTYDSNGNLLTKTDPLGRKTTYTYNSMNEVLTTTDPLGVTTKDTYDTAGNLLSTSTPIGSQVAKTSYTDGDSSHPGDVTMITDPDGHVTKYTYDAQGDRTSVTDGLGDKETFTYNVIGERTTMVTPRGNVTRGNPTSFTTTYTYDALGDLLTTNDPLGHTTTNTYDSDQNLITATDADSDTTTDTYDLDNELTQSARTDASDTVLDEQETAYDADGNVTSETDGLGNSTNFTYDPLNRKTSSTDALAHETTYTYDLVGNLTSITDPDGRVTTDTYDADNELTGVSYSDGITPDVSYTYDKDGQRSTMTDGTGTTTYTRDALHRLTKVKDGAGQTVKYKYDLVGNLTKIIYPSGNKVKRTYDLANRLTAVTDWLGHKTTFTYDADSNLVTETYPNSVKAQLTYDDADELTSITDKAGAIRLMSLAYSEDPVGLVTSENSTTYGYDGADRVTSSSASPDTYTYDEADELTGIGSTTLAYNAANELTSSTSGSGTVSYTDNNEGDRIDATPSSGSASTYTYDQADRLTGFTNGASTASYAYNGDGLRMSKTVNSTVEPFVWDASETIPLLIQDGTTSYVNGPAGFPIEQISGSGAVTYFQQERLGSTSMLSNSTGAVVATYTYDPYGNVTSSTGSVTNPILFAGQYLDSESNLYYLNARYYDPTTGQFLTRDPLVTQTRQPYEYAKDSPTNLTDPSGLICFGFLGCINGPSDQEINNFISNAETLHQVPVLGFLTDQDPFYTTFRDIIYSTHGITVCPQEAVSDAIGLAGLGGPSPADIAGAFGLGENLFEKSASQINAHLGVVIDNHPGIETTVNTLVPGGIVQVVGPTTDPTPCTGQC